jgi:hypothetical protein
MARTIRVNNLRFKHIHISKFKYSYLPQYNLLHLLCYILPPLQTGPQYAKTTK